ncbi:MAG TPA: O-antigen ligase family protein [Candidatus Omnitrophota bacterium]|nr:O-antigen ligase family protein [Candidatus Omnitrophota bacterium]HPS36519.1 O-antigen ligase family protein [Candidatus Omnitrophota bacterium]
MIQLLTYGLFFLAVLMRLVPDTSGKEAAHSVSLQKSEFLKLGCLTGVLSLLFHSLYDFNLHIPANGVYFVVLLALGAGAVDKVYDHAFFRRMVGFLITVGFLIALFAIVQKFSYNGQIFWIGLTAPNPVGPYYNYDHYAGFMELCGAVAISMAVANIVHTSFFYRKGLVEKILWFSTKEANKAVRYLLMSAVMVATIFMSTSRGGIMSFILSQIIFFAIVFWAIGRSRKGKRLIGVLVAVVFLAGVVVVWLGPEAFLKRFHMTSIDKIFKIEGPDAYRIQFYQGTAKVIRDFPILGTGLGTFGTNFTRYRQFDFRGGTDYLRYTHNDYLQLVSETGIPGLLFLIGFMIFYLAAILRVARKLE